MDKFAKYNELLCNEFCEEMKKFEEHPEYKQLKIVKDLAETWADMQCIEAGYAMRKIAEKKYGYGSDMEDWEEDDIYSIFDAVRGGRRGRRSRDSRGRYTANRGGRSGRGGMYNAMEYPYMPPMYNDYDYDDDDYGYPMYNRERRRDRRDERRDRRMGETYDEYDPNNTYMVRQQNGHPIVTPYAKYEKGIAPKKLTKEQYEEWVEDMVNADGSSGAHWTIEQTKQLQKKKGYEEVEPYAFWAALNATYSDLCDFFKKHNIDNADAYADYTMDFWFEDEDSVNQGEPNNPAKLAAYYWHVVEK